MSDRLNSPFYGTRFGDMMRLNTSKRFDSLAVAFGLVFAAGSALGQANASVVRPHTIEIDPFIGVTYGGTGIGSSGETRVMGGANVSYALTKYILPYVEYSYFPGIPQTKTGSIMGSNPPMNFSAAYSSPLQDFHGGVHIRIPIHESPFVPYGVIGFGNLHSNETPVTVSVPGLQPFPLTVASSNNFTVNAGGGLRVYIKQHFGIRGEAKIYKPTGVIDSTFGKVEFGFFFQLN